MIGTGTVLVLWALLGGRTFCSWVCPYHLLAEWAEYIHLYLVKKKLVTDQNIDRRLRTLSWIVFAVLAAATGYTVFEAISPTGILSRALIYGPGLALLWVLGQQSGIDGAGALLALLVSGAFILWALTLRGRARAAFATLSIAIFVLLTLGIGQNVVKFAETPSATATTDRWQPWAPGKVDALMASGRPVFVDFTAAWCVTCQYNKKTTLANAAVLADFDAKKVHLLRADWTRRDPAITAALSALGRNGVPVYVLYQKGRAPVVLSEILGVDELRSALAAL